MRDWPRRLIARPVGARSLPVVAALRGLARLAAPRTRARRRRSRRWPANSTGGRPIDSLDFGSRFLDNYGYNEWVGQRGAFMSDRVACGVLLLGPDTEYPDHSHEAEELYLPLAGRAFWRSDEADWRLRPPGTWIHHPSWTVHAMRTSQEPLLAAYVWRAGDLTAKSGIGR